MSDGHTEGTQRTPHDQPARDRILTDLDACLFVEAGAGTGKTASLVERIVRLVAAGRATLDRVAAITFTEAAAAELRDRIRERLEQAQEDRESSPEERARCADGVRALDLAAVETLHGFAGRLLRERPLEAGLPPAFQVVDGIAADLAFEDAWQDWLDATLDDEALVAPLRLGLSLGLRLGQLRDVAEAFHREYDWLEQTSFAAPVPPTPVTARALIGQAPELERLLDFAWSKGEEDPLAVHTRGVLRLARRLRDLPDQPPPGEASRLLAAALSLASNRGNKGDWDTDPLSGDNACARLKALLRELESSRREELAQARRAALLPLLDAVRAFILEYAQRRKREGRAEFHDLLVWARNLLRDDIAVRDHFRARFSHVLIDETQDTDPIQAEIAFFLVEDVAPGTPPEARPRRWTDLRPAPGKLFVVGDAKQSIYRFRRADAFLMARVRSALGDGPDASASLMQNFRTQRRIVQWVNHVFGLWMAAADGSRQVSYASLVHWWDLETEHPMPPGVWALGGPGGDRDRTDEVRERESREIAAVIRRAHDEGWPVRDGDAMRAARFADVCVLMPRRTGLRALETALEEMGVPYRLEGSSLVFGTQEVRDLLNCLRAVDDPSDQVALVGALRSPAFACSDVDLLRFVEVGGRLDYLSAVPAAMADSPVAQAFSALAACHQRRRWESPPALIEGFIRDRRLFESALAAPRPREQWRRYRFLVEQARAFAQACGGSLRTFLSWAAGQAAEGARTTDFPVPEADDDAVRVMTVHAAKGLEFPIVVLTGLNNDRPPRSDAVLLDRDAGAVEVRLSGPFETAGYPALARRERALAADEGVRLMYVAATRARDHLIVSVHRKRGDTASPAARIAGLLADGPGSALWSPLMADDAPAGTTIPVPPAEDDARDVDDDTAEARAAWLAARDGLLKQTQRPRVVAATTLATVDKEEQDRPEAPWRRGRGGTAFGRAAHAVLQTVDLATGAGIEETARAQAAAEGIPNQAKEIAALCHRALASDAVKRAVASGRWWREAPVGAPLGDSVLEGFIDLLFREPDGLVIVDYKTDAVADEAEVDVVMARYGVQGAAYAVAIERALGEPVKEVRFLFLRPALERSLDNLPALMAAIPGQVSRFVESG